MNNRPRSQHLEPPRYAPPPWPNAPDRVGAPVCLIDYQVARRSRLHALYFPGGGQPFATTHLIDALEAVHSAGYDHVCLIHDPGGEQPRHQWIWLLHPELGV